MRNLQKGLWIRCLQHLKHHEQTSLDPGALAEILVELVKTAPHGLPDPHLQNSPLQPACH